MSRDERVPPSQEVLAQMLNDGADITTETVLHLAVTITALHGDRARAINALALALRKFPLSRDQFACVLAEFAVDTVRGTKRR